MVSACDWGISCYTDGYGSDSRPLALIPEFENLPEVIQKLFQKPTVQSFDEVIGEISLGAISSNDISGLLTGQEVLQHDPHELYYQIYNPETVAAASVNLLRMVAIATARKEEAGCTSSQAARFLNDFLQVYPRNLLDMQFYYTPLVNSGMKTFAHLLLKYVETNVNDFMLDHGDNGFTVAAIQLNSPFADSIVKVRNNVDKIGELVVRAAQGGAKFIVTPELAVHGYVDVNFSNQYNNESDFWAGAQRMWCHESVYSPCPDSIEIGINSTIDFINGPRVLTNQGSRAVQLVDASAVALSHDSEEFTSLQDIAQTHGAYVQVGYMEKAEEDGEERIYNSVNVYGPSGNLAYHHRKTSLYRTVDRLVFTESELPSTPYFDTPYGRISSAICYEGNSIFQPLYEHQVDTMLYSVAWVVSPSFYAPGYHTAGEKVKDYPMNVVMANWAFPDNPPVQLNVCSENTYRVWDGDAQRIGSGLSYVMDSDGNLRGLLTGNSQEDVLFATLPRE